MGSILGGGGKTSSSSAQGYAALSPELRSVFDQLGIAAGQYTNPNNPGVVDRFTPLAQTADETEAISRIRSGFTPTAETLGRDISMLSNPFDQYVIDDINRQSQGDFSILKQAQSAAGQLGSNRGMLGANDIEQTRLGTIGKFRQGQYNSILDTIFNQLVPQRQQDTAGMLNIGGFQRGLDSAAKLAPVTALQAGTGMIGPFTAGGTSNNVSSGGGGALSGLGNFAGGIGTAWNAYKFSDARLKENIAYRGKENGHNVYEFSYRGSPEKHIGVLAQEVRKTAPEAVHMHGGYYVVDYNKLGVIPLIKH
jgi:Chaperone of endosialidase